MRIKYNLLCVAMSSDFYRCAAVKVTADMAGGTWFTCFFPSAQI